MAVGSLGTLALVMTLLWPAIKTRAPAAIHQLHVPWFEIRKPTPSCARARTGVSPLEI